MSLYITVFSLLGAVLGGIRLCEEAALKGYSYVRFLKMLTREQGGELFFLLSAALIHLIGCAVPYDIAAYIMLPLSCVPAAIYAFPVMKNKERFLTALKLLPVYFAAVALLCFLGFFSGGAALMMLYVLSPLICALCAAVYKRLSRKKRRESYHREALQMFETAVVFSGLKQDTAGILKELIKVDGIEVYEDLSPEEIFKKEGEAKKGILVYGITDENDAFDIVLATRPHAVAVLGAKGEADSLFEGELLSLKAEAICDNPEFFKRVKAKNPNENSEKYAVTQEENAVLYACAELLKSLGSDKEKDISAYLKKYGEVENF